MPASGLLLALALLPAAAAPDAVGAADEADTAPYEYTLRLRFEQGGESRLFHSRVLLGESYNTVLASSGSVREHAIVNVMPVAVDGSDRVELLYQVEWDVGGAILQAQDSAQLSPREDAVLSSQPGAWTLRGHIQPNSGVDTCVPPPAGGGLLVTARVRLGGRERTFTRRTVPFVMSNLLYKEPGQEEALTLILEVQPNSEGHPPKVRAAAEHGKLSVLGAKPGVPSPFGQETLVAGDAAGDAIWATVAELPPTKPAKTEVPELSDPSGWLRHAGPVLTFLHPPRWKVRPSCDETLTPTGWSLRDTALSPEERSGRIVSFYVPPPDPRPAAARAALRVATLPAAQRKAPETVKSPAGDCLLWRVDDEVTTGHAVCDLAGGLQLEGIYSAPLNVKDAFGEFRKVLASLARGKK